MRKTSFGAFRKVSENPDGTLTVEGIASTGARDSMGEIVLPSAMKAAIPDYLAFPAIREMHDSAKAAGTALSCSVDETGATVVSALIVDPVAILKVSQGVYRGFSIGGQVLKRDPVDRSIITELRLTEISICDRPANPECVLTMFKADAPTAPRDPVEALEAALAAALETAKACSVAVSGFRYQSAVERSDEDLLRGLENHPELTAALRKFMSNPTPPKTAAGGHALRAIDKGVDRSGQI